MDNTVHERICSRAANVLSLAVSGPAVVVLSWSAPTWTWPQHSPAYLICPDRVLWPTAAPPPLAPCAGKHPYQAQ